MYRKGIHQHARLIIQCGELKETRVNKFNNAYWQKYTIPGARGQFGDQRSNGESVLSRDLVWLWIVIITHVLAIASYKAVMLM